MNTKSQHFKHLGSSWVWQLALHSVEVYKRVLNLTEVFWRPVAFHIIGSKQSRSIKKSSVHLKVSVNHTGKSQHRNVSIYFLAAFHAANGQANQANIIIQCVLDSKTTVLFFSKSVLQGAKHQRQCNNFVESM